VVSLEPDKFSAVTAVIAAIDIGAQPERMMLREAVRTLLTQLAAQNPGRSVEVRVPPFGAVQCVSGPRHTRGTPANVVEMDGVTFVLLATGRLDWREAAATARISASGTRSDISGLFPV
jgi:hypothetical protein